MSTLVVDLPGAVENDGPLALVFARLRAEHPAIEVRARGAEAIGIAIESADGELRRLLSVPVARDEAGEGALAIAPGLSLRPAAAGDVSSFLREQWRGGDHVGINFSHRQLDEPTWQSFVKALGAAVPAWRLDVGSVNDIVFIVIEGVDADEDAATAAVVELVYDRTALRSSVHFCVRVAAGRAAVEREFAAPCGGYKPGDEAFFRSVALPSATTLPIYIDLAFSEAQVAPWPQTVRAIGRRIE